MRRPVRIKKVILRTFRIYRPKVLSSHRKLTAKTRWRIKHRANSKAKANLNLKARLYKKNQSRKISCILLR